MEIHLNLIADNTELCGDLSEVAVDAAYVNSMFSSNPRIYRLDNASGSTQVLDATAAAVSQTPGSFSPFSGSVIPAGATLKVYEATAAGDWASVPLTLISGSIADFQSTGWKLLRFADNEARAAWRPSNSPVLNMPSRRYIMVELDDGGGKDAFIFADDADHLSGIKFRVDTAGGPGTAPLISGVDLLRAEDSFKNFDLTARSAGDLNTAYTPASDTWVPIVGGTAIYGFEGIPREIIEYVFRQNGSATTYKVEVTGAGSSWIDITSQYTSASDFRQDGPVVSTVPAEHFVSALPTVPGFTKRSIGTLKMEAGADLVTPALYYVRMTILASNAAPQPVSIYRLRCKQYGSASRGITMTAAKTLRSATLHLRGPRTGTGDRRLTIANLVTAEARDMTIPNTAVQGDFVHFDFADMAFAAAQKLGVLGSTGGAAWQDATLFLED